MCLSCLHDTICDDDPCEREDHYMLEGIVASCPPAPETLAETAGLIRQWYRLCDNFGVGGPLHIQLDDSNTEDCFLTTKVYDEAWENWYAADRTPERYAMGLRILELLRPMTEAEREMTIASAHHERMPALLGIKVDGETPYGHP